MTSNSNSGRSSSAARKSPSSNSSTASNSRSRISIAYWLDVPPWTVIHEEGPDQRTPNFAAVVQEIIGQPGWQSGNNMLIMIDGTGEREAESHDGEAGGDSAPVLTILWTVPEGWSPQPAFAFRRRR